MTPAPGATLILVRVGSPSEAADALSIGADGALIAGNGSAIIGAPTPMALLPIGARLPDAASLAATSDARPTVLLVDTTPDRLLSVHPYPALARFAEAARGAGRAFGLCGALEAADLPRLAPLGPAFLAFDAAELEPAARLAALRAALSPAAPPSGADRTLVFVRDLLLDMELGAYRSERGRRQRVRVSMEADVALAGRGGSIAGVYSYDRMIDAAQALLSQPPEPFVETLAERLADEILLDPRVVAVMVRLEKLDLGPGSAGVEIRRERPRIDAASATPN